MEPPQGPPLTPYSGPPQPGWTPPGADPTRRASNTKVVVVVLVLVAAVAVAGFVFLWSIFGGRGDAANESLAPSERPGAAPTTLPEGLEVPETTGLNRDEFGILDDDASEDLDQVYNELGCVFTGTSMMDPPLSISLFRHSGPHRMTLEPGASFECRDGTREESAGTIGLDAVFESMTALKGTAAGTGWIEWSQVGPSAGEGASIGMRSNTAVEIELDVPVIVVWTTILDGPYAGYKGRLVLASWEIVYDSAGLIAGVRFEPTEAVFDRS